MRHFWLDLLPEFLVRNLHLSEKDATHKIQKKDKQRASYYNYYSNKKWGDAASYHYCLDSSYLGVQGTVDLLKFLVDKKEGKV